jgi:hypothetical protein
VNEKHDIGILWQSCKLANQMIKVVDNSKFQQLDCENMYNNQEKMDILQQKIEQNTWWRDRWRMYHETERNVQVLNNGTPNQNFLWHRKTVQEASNTQE